MRFLKQSTSAVLTLGPFVDATDGFTQETGLSPSATNVRLYKAGATVSVDISAATWTHIENGIYRVTLTTSHTDTAGPMLIVAAISGAKQVVHEFNVLSSSAYEAMVTGAAIPANMTQIVGNATAATLLVFGALGMKNFTVGAGSTSIRIATDLTESTSAHWAGARLVFISGSLAGQRTSVTAYNGSTKELTVSALTDAPSVGDSAVLV